MHFVFKIAEPVMQMVQSVVSHRSGVAFQPLSPFVQQNKDFLGHFYLPCTWPTFSVKTIRTQSSGLPPGAKTSALSLAPAHQPRKHLRGRLLSDTFSASARLAQGGLLGSPPPDRSREA